MTIKARLDQFAKRIRPLDEHLEEANRQANYMIDEMHDCVSEDGRFTLEKILKAGSNAKATSLRRTNANTYDVDLGAYFSGEDATKDHLSTLLTYTRKQLTSIYPNKPADDFEPLKSAVRVHFRSGIQLRVDVAPIIRDDSLGIDNGGWIPRSDGWRLTSITCHNEFISRRTTQSIKVPGPVRFNRLVRMIKWWNNLQGDLCQPSYLCDLVTAAAFDAHGVTEEWQSSLRQIFSFLRRLQFLTPIIFSDYYDPSKLKLPKDPVIILDSVNPENNVAYDWTEKTRQAYMERVQDAYDALMDARSCELDGDEDGAVEQWCRVFGDDFRELSESDE